MINSIQGDVRKPIGTGNKLIIHCCNDQGIMGAGVALALMKFWLEVKTEYRRWHDGARDAGIIISDDGNCGFHLGAIQVIDVEKDLAVVNMIGQHSCGYDRLGHPPIRYYAIIECLKKVKQVAIERNATVNLPYLMGCGLAGGDWDYMKQILEKELNGIQTTAYNFS